MLLVPRQLQRAGMTGQAPYYGGRLTPRQAYGAAHPDAPPLSYVSVDSRSAAPTAPEPEPAPPRVADPAAALKDLLESGVISQEEYDDLSGRVSP